MSLAEYIPPDWAQVLRKDLAAPWFAELEAFVVKQRAEGDVYPPEPEVFAAFRLTPFATVRAVILGQDPYHRRGQAQGLPVRPSSGATLAAIRRSFQIARPHGPSAFDRVSGWRPWQRGSSRRRVLGRRRRWQLPGSSG